MAKGVVCDAVKCATFLIWQVQLCQATFLIWQVMLEQTRSMVNADRASLFILDRKRKVILPTIYIRMILPTILPMISTYDSTYDSTDDFYR